MDVAREVRFSELCLTLLYIYKWKVAGSWSGKRTSTLQLEYLLFTSIQGLVTFTMHISQTKIIKKWKKHSIRL